MSVDSIKWWPVMEVHKFSQGTIQDIVRQYNLEGEPDGNTLALLRRKYSIDPDEITIREGNALVNTGRQRLSDLVTGSGAQAFTTSRGMAGVGDSSTAWAATQTTLQASTNTYYQIIDSTGFSSTTGTITATSTFTSGNGNYAWQEWCWAIATAAPVSSATFTTATTSGIMINRAVQSLGTKASGSTWVLNGTVAIS